MGRPFSKARAREKQFEREMEFHLQKLIEEKVAGGAAPEKARREALVEFGGREQWKEECRDVQRLPLVDSLAAHLRWAWRSLKRSPGFAAAVCLTLALGIGANSAVFSAIDAVLLRALPYPEADRLVVLHQSKRDGKASEGPVAPVRLEDWNRMSRAFSGISGYYTEDISELSGALPERLHQILVAPRFFRVLGVSPALGRDFTPAEEHFGGPNAALISDAYWRRHFHGDPQAIGKALRFGAFSYTVIGVMPARFAFPSREADIWTISAPDAPYAQDRASTWFTAVGRLKPGQSIAQGRADLARVQAQLGREFPKTDKDLAAVVQPLKDTIVKDSGRSLWLLFGSVSLLLLIACTNVAALLLARTTDRMREIAIRYSLGASRRSVIAQLLTESLLIALAGSAIGLGLASAATVFLRQYAKALPRVDEIALDWRVVLYTLACGVFATLLFGLAPALDATRRTIASSLAGQNRAQVSSKRPLQWLLVGAQVALAATLLVGAALLLRSLAAMSEVSPGFDASHVLTLQISANWGETVDRVALQRRIERDLDGLRDVPGVSSAATSATVPGAADAYPTELRITDAGRRSLDPITSDSKVVSDGYFETMRIPLLAGQGCSRQTGWNTVVVNRSFADAFAHGEALIGHHLEWAQNPYHEPPAEIRGMAADARENGITHAPVPMVYWCANDPSMAPNFLLRTAGDPSGMARSIRTAMKKIEPARSVFAMVPLSDLLSDTNVESRLRTILLALFALTAVALASVGLYGTLSYFVNIRRREVGLRMALGAIPNQILGRFLAQGMAVALAGCAAGLVLAAAFSRLLAGMLYGVSRADPISYGGVAALLSLVAMAASMLPAARASRLDPMRTLREE